MRPAREWRNEERKKGRKEEMDMNKSDKTGVFLAVLAAALYAINSPFSKLLLDVMPPTLMAGFLYVGAGLGIGVIVDFFTLLGKPNPYLVF